MSEPANGWLVYRWWTSLTTTAETRHLIAGNERLQKMTTELFSPISRPCELWGLRTTQVTWQPCDRWSLLTKLSTCELWQLRSTHPFLDHVNCDVWELLSHVINPVSSGNVSFTQVGGQTLGWRGPGISYVMSGPSSPPSVWWRHTSVWHIRCGV